MAVVLCLLAAQQVWLAPAAQSAELFTIEPSSGAVGDRVTASGTGWFPSTGEVRVFVNTDESSDPANAVLKVVPDSSGSFSESFDVPPRSPRTYRFFACQVCVDNPDGFPSDFASFTIEPPPPELAVNPGLVRPAETLTASGSGWLPGLGPVSLFVDPQGDVDPEQGLAIADPTPDATISAGLIVPELTVGDHQLFACQDCGNPKGFPSDTATFTITPARPRPQLALTPRSGTPGTNVSASGSGWTVSLGPVRVFADRSDVAPGSELTSVSPADGGVLGGVFTTTLVVPDRSPGEHTFYACQVCGDVDDSPSASAPFSITTAQPPQPRLSLTPNRGKPGETVTAAGAGWQMGGAVVRVFARHRDMSLPDRALVTVLPDDEGSFVVPMSLPSLSPGEHRLFACQPCGPESLQASARYALTPGAVKPVLEVRPGAAGIGDQVTATGSGWSARRGPVWLFSSRDDIATPERALAVVRPDPTDRFSTSLDVPEASAGTQFWFACQACGDPDGYPAATARFTVIIQVPVLVVTPDSGRTGDRVSATGSNWLPAGGPVRIFASQAESSDPRNALVVVRPGVDGNFETTVTVPDRDSDEYQFFACQRCGDQLATSATAAFTIERGPWIRYAIIALFVAALLVTAAAKAKHRYENVRATPELRLRRPGDDFQVHGSDDPRQWQPSLQLVPHDDELVQAKGE